MRLLTPNEQRQVEQLKQAVKGHESLTIVINSDDKELWLNILDMVLQTQDAMKTAWQKSDNPIINLRG